MTSRSWAEGPKMKVYGSTRQKEHVVIAAAFTSSPKSADLG